MRIGLDVGGTKTEAVALDVSGGIIARVRRPTGWGPDAVIESIAATVADVAEVGGFAASGITSVGVGVPGIIDDSGAVSHAVNLGVERLGLEELLRGRFGVPVTIENDVKAAAIGASSLHEGCGSLAFLNLGTGVAAGIVIDGMLWRGARGTAGEVGHLSIDPRGPECGCGQRGCIEAFCGGGPVSRAWGHPGSFPIRDLFDAADRGDQRAGALRDDLFRAAAAAVRVLVLTTDVETVVIGGGLTALGERLGSGIVTALRSEGAGSPFLASLRLHERIELLPAGSPVAALGAALIGTTRRPGAHIPADIAERSPARG